MRTKALNNKKLMLRWPWHSPLHCLNGNVVANTALAIANAIDAAAPSFTSHNRMPHRAEMRGWESWNSGRRVLDVAPSSLFGWGAIPIHQKS